MGKYHALQIFKYENPNLDVNAEYRARIENPTAIITGLTINPEQSGQRLGQQYPLFLVPVPEVLQLEGVINQNSRKIDKLVNSLPPIASEQFFNKTLVDEIMGTNEIEDVKTTNKEVNDAITSAQSKSHRKIRLQSFAKMYLKIKDKRNLKITSLKDIREIYDYLLEGEISTDQLPDGTLFRNRYVRVGGNFETVHQPKSSEQEIALDLKDWITFINDDSITPILKSFIAHYYFENVHPFNDGNGRTGRYITCVYLGYKLDPLSAITFSSETSKNKEKYYKAFKSVSNQNNFGEVTFFVIDMMKILIKGQKEIIKKMSENKDLLTFMDKNIKSDSSLNDVDRSLLFLYSQAFSFNDSGAGLEDRELKKYTTEYHWTSVKESINELTTKKVLKKTKQSPLTRRINGDYFQKFN